MAGEEAWMYEPGAKPEARAKAKARVKSKAGVKAWIETRMKPRSEPWVDKAGAGKSPTRPEPTPHATTHAAGVGLAH